MGIKAKTVEEKLVAIKPESIESLKAIIHGRVILPTEEGYDAARKIWNRMINRRPALIIECSGTADVMRAVRFASENNLLISVRGAGHNIAGRAIEDDVLLIDLSKLRSVHVDPDAQTVVVSPGATLADIDNETQNFGLALPVGINSTTGVAGLTLGGGFGWLSRKFGMTIDSLLSAELITVDGKRLICSKDQNQDLFWAIRGGGGNFGIVTSFTFKLHKVGPMVMAGPLIFNFKDAKEVMYRYRDFCKQAPKELTVWALMRHCPPFPFVDPAFHGKLVLILVGIFAGPIEEGKKVMDQLKALGELVGDGLGPHPFAAFQKAFDPMLTPGARNYWKTHNFKTLDDKLIDILIQEGSKLPSPQSEIFFAQMGGETNRVAQDATAYPHRDVEFIMNVHTRWENKNDDNRCITFAKEIFEAVKPFATQGAYVNFVSEGDDNLAAAYSKNFDKLVAIKTKYDPKNVLRSNLNIAS